MVRNVYPFERLHERLEELRKDSERMKELAQAGFISERFRRYSDQLLILDHLVYESEVYAELGDIAQVGESLVEMRHCLDGVGGILIMGSGLETEDIEGGLKVIKNPNLDNLEKYQGLYDFAKGRYESALSKCERLLGAA